jgi:tetratricopeptide (TPR) repeat protein
MHKSKFFYFVFALILIIVSCAPTKNTGSRRFYHKLVSRYNIYFNGNEALKQAMIQLANSHKDDYTQILEVFPYGTETEAMSIVPAMDRANEKGSKVILKHSMSFKNIEYNPWVIKSYMLIGKSRFFKRDYLAATETFDFISKRYSSDPVRYDATLWLAKTHLYAGRLSRSEALFGILEYQIQMGNTSKEVVQMYPRVRAQYHIRTGQLGEAVKYVERALEQRQKRKDRIRLNFIAAQIYQRLENNAKAIEYYQKTLKFNPPYDIAFRAKLFMAECYDSGVGKGDFIVKELHKMLRDKKNKDYLDEIYYALAQIELNKRDSIKAVEFLSLSTSNSVDNQVQKGLSFLKLAEIHFAQKKYKPAKLYYDSTVAFLPKHYAGFPKIDEKSKILTELMLSLETIQVQDSLQRISALPEKELLAKIDNIIRELIRQEELEQQRKRQEELAMMGQGSGPGMMGRPVSGGAEWYFYNQSAINFGKTEFRQKWGERKLDDLWRIHNKQMIMFEDFPDDIFEGQEDQELLAENNDPKKREFYLKDLLDTPEKIENSNKKIELAHYNAGTVYKDKLKDLQPASEMFTNLLQRFPETELKLKSYYNLYLIYQILKQTSQVEKYKKLILEEYPESEFAKIISDPDYYKNIALQANEVKEFYKTTYLLFLENQFNQVINNAVEAKSKFNDPNLIPKFEYLKALSIARTSSIDSLKKQLSYIVTNYPNSEVRPQAELLLSYYSDDVKDVLLEEKTLVEVEVAELYKHTPASFHLFILIVDVKTSNMNTIRTAVSEHNQQYFRGKNLTISSLFLTDLRQLVTVSRFNNKEEAEQYLKLFLNNKEMNNTLLQTNPLSFVISTDNYPVFYKDKSEIKYLEFFSKHYMK